MRPRAVILLAFANDWADDRRHLRNLLEEDKAIHRALEPLTDTGALAIQPATHNATLSDVIGAFQHRRDRDRIRIFHFGGHASASTLLFENPAGQPTAAHAYGLAGYLGGQRGLVLVFLNGCSTAPQVARLREAGVKAVVATTCEIQDAPAAEFAKVFYAELATRSLRDAFDAAVHVMHASYGDTPRSVTRDLVTQPRAHDAATPPWPWSFSCDPRYERWTLAREVARQTWQRRLILATTMLLASLAASFVISVSARRAVCWVPGLHALCGLLRIPGVPTAEEQARWDRATRLRTGDGLREYLRTYPEGAYADEAIARRAGCRLDHTKTLGPEEDLRFPLVINPAFSRLLDSEADARTDALARGNEEAKSSCGGLRAADAYAVLSTRAEPQRWECANRAGRFTCGFFGESVCRVRRGITEERENCLATP